MMRWTRHIRESLAHELLFGWPESDKAGWDSTRRFPVAGSKRERVARIALARALRTGDEFFVGAVAALIDPCTESTIVTRKIEFVRAKDRRHESKTSRRRDIEIAAFLHEWREQHRGESTEATVAATADHFGFADRVIWNVWKNFKPKSGK
jgi:hypothetical protein